MWTSSQQIALHFNDQPLAKADGIPKTLGQGAFMTTDATSPRAAPATTPVWAYAAGAAALVGLQVAILHGFGQPLIAASGHIVLWVGEPRSADTSQQLTDWYSFSHIIHGFIFFWLLRLLAPRLPLATRLLMAMAIEISWEAA